MYTFGSLAGHWTAFGLFSGIAVLCGYGITRIGRELAAPVGHLPFYGTTPRARRMIGVALATGLLVAIWMWLWTGFHELTLAPDAITLHYYVPSRQRAIARQEVDSADWEAGFRSTRVFVIRTRDGTRFASMQISISDEDATAVVDEIRSALGLNGT